MNVFFSSASFHRLGSGLFEYSKCDVVFCVNIDHWKSFLSLNYNLVINLGRCQTWQRIKLAYMKQLLAIVLFVFSTPQSNFQFAFCVLLLHWERRNQIYKGSFITEIIQRVGREKASFWQVAPIAKLQNHKSL